MKTYRIIAFFLIGTLPSAASAQGEIILRGRGQDNTIGVTGSTVGAAVPAASQAVPVAPGALGLSGEQTAPVPAGSLGVVPTVIAPNGSVVPATSGLGFPAPGTPVVPTAGGTPQAPAQSGNTGTSGNTTPSTGPSR